MTLSSSGLKIAVIGGGVAGIVSAYLLDRSHQVTLFEKNDYVGGHTHTVDIPDGPDAGAKVDTGFIVHNDRTYPNFIKFIGQLGVERIKCPMSFSYFDRRTRFQYSSATPFADPKNFFSISFWRLLYDILRFNKMTLLALQNDALNNMSLGQYLTQSGFGDDFINRYIIPMGAAIWSTPDDKMLEFPALTFARFFENHGLLAVRNQPQWYTIKGGSRQYVDSFLKKFSGKVFTNSPVQKIARENGKVKVHLAGSEGIFDCAVIAAHADEAFEILADPSPEEQKLLSPWQYTKNKTILHRDASYLPPIARARASWNYIREDQLSGQAPMTMTYYMNLLQDLKTRHDYCVTLNPARRIDASAVVGEYDYTHPQYTFKSMQTQAALDTLNGCRNTYFCGSYFKYGFHEDAVASAVNVAAKFGIPL
jgi:predicted NAD/FAD-binding protein